jgi:uncharacterized RDD family membrane protein YckC
MNDSSDQLAPFALDQLTIHTPEQVAIRFPVAGLGSRFLAIFADSMLQAAAWIGLFVILLLIASSAPKTHTGELSHNGEKWLIAGVILFNFLMYWGYFTLFEAFWNGQTPGKKLFKIRVIQDSGRQITLFESMTRNLIRIIDYLPGFYLVGVIAMLCNPRHQRLGDLAAGTLVIHERASESPLWDGSGARTFTAASFSANQTTVSVAASTPALFTLPADAVARLSSHELQVIERFFSRMLDMDLATRAQLARRLLTQMEAKMQWSTPADVNPERVLEAIAHRMRGGH